jgi:hypothetical protein
MIIIILVCIGFGTSTHLTNAYGLTGASLSMKSNSSRDGHDRHDNFACDGNVLRVGIHFYHPDRLSPILRCTRWCILGLYRKFRVQN